MTVRRALYLLALAWVVIVLLICSGLFGLVLPFFLTVGLLLIGWALHLIRLIKELVFDADATLTASIALALFIVGVHALAKKWRRSTTADEVKAWTWSSTFGVVALLVCVAIAGIAAVGIAHQSVWLAIAPQWIESGSIRQAVARTQSQNNLKQLVLAALDFHQQKKHLPPGATFDADARPQHSWATLLLPYVEYDSLYKRVDLDRPWTDPHNQETFGHDVPVYLNPAVAETKVGRLSPCHYAGNVHVLGAKSMRLQDITDGTASTLLFGEAASKFKPWGQPLNWRDPALGINTSPYGFGNPSMAGASFTFADGSVRFLKDSISPAVLKALATPAGGDANQLRDWE